MRKPIPFHPL
jgi:hypothetical protein